MPTVTIRCTYQACLGLEPTEVTFRLSPAHGCQSPEEALELIKCLRQTEVYFELQPESDEAPLPFWSETVREVSVR